MTKKLSTLIDSIAVQEVIGDPSVIHIEQLTQDSRAVAQGSMFIAVKGTVVDGHQYIATAIESGATAIVCEVIPEEVDPRVVWIRVSHSMAAVGLLASCFYGAPSQQLKMIGVTGTNGKTTIATLLHDLFSKMGYYVGLLSTIENRIGSHHYPSTHTTPDPISLQGWLAKMVEDGCSHCFMEVSSHAIDQHRIAGIDFDGAIFTNITHDHLDYHKTFKNYIAVKKKFFDDLKPQAFALTNRDDKNGEVMLQNCDAKAYSYSVRAQATYKASVIEQDLTGMQLLLDRNEIWTPFVGKFNVSNLLAVYGAAVLSGESSTEVIAAISQLQPINGRLETLHSKDGKVAIIDYAHTPDALENVLKTIDEIRTRNEQVITVVGCGGNRDTTKRPLMAKIATQYSDRVILTSDNPRFEDPEMIIKDMKEGVSAAYTSRVLSITNRAEAIRTAIALSSPQDIVLVAGKGHEDYQEIEGKKYPFDDHQIVENELNA
ncbi:UDP-N-acetylmuramoyl-L-alanyl-D-glutamate--2,6-diaminopimelate ligase [Halosquirtibacter xylanolyticus]|uniref:UDP-N-acetylmuramoyl-L-alanyl-D-glutamate--2, 6-diaminopimelate ligase n=1 Tax=Halosquirtibacter xylanolyticus TaxID=3374599 RepID=UPI00374982EF|nr:UDP-N-acetylmuramoyl-L-alanyl-D-glutamate--2,6-diaminopimelate ligase [Prolixibacteraceae bacterium]